jgi:DNA ligase-1
MTFSEFSQKLLKPLEATSSKLEQTALLAEFLKQLQPDLAEPSEVKPYLYLSLGQLGPVYANPQTNVGIAFMLRALAQLHPSEGQSLFGDAGADPTELKRLSKRYKQLGDIGSLAQEVKEQFTNQSYADNFEKSNLDVLEVFNFLIELTQTSGEGSQEEKVYQLAQLFKQIDPLSSRFVSRIVLGNLRLGFSDKTWLDALSWYLSGDKSHRAVLDQTYQRHPDIGAIAEKVVGGGLEAAAQLDVTLGVPVIPALADRLKTSQEMIAKMGEVFVEPKYDGTRVQIHWDADKQELHTFTRNLEENTLMFPELKRLLEDINAQSVILDCEAVGYDPATNGLVVFQQTIKRKRKHDIEAVMAEIPLRFFVFDLLYLDGKSLLRFPLEERKAKLKSILSSVHSADLVLSPYIKTSDPVELREFHTEQLLNGYEGVVVKKLQGNYEAGRKAFNWVKFKEAEGTTAKLSDTIDAVVVGYYYGRGKRTAFGLGAFLIAIQNEKSDHLVTIAKIGTGLTDDQWREMKQRADDVLAERGSVSANTANLSVEIPDLLTPDVMLPPGIVVEVAADEITQSPTHTAGLALRFPRLVKFRDDKSVEQITTLAEMEKIKVA